MNRYLQHPLGAPMAVLAGLALVLGLARFTVPTNADVATSQTSREPIGATAVVCPEPSGGRIAVATAPGGDGTGRVVARTVSEGPGDTADNGAGGDTGGGSDGAGRRLGKVAQRGVIWTKTMGERAPATQVHANGSMAASLEVEQTSNTGTGAGQGLSATRCTRPDTSFWFVADGVELGRTTVLHLVNTDEAPVSVSVDVYGPNGPVSSAAGDGINIQPNTATSIQLGALAPKPSPLALRVRSETGPVVAALHTRVKRGEQPHGTDWIPPTAHPRKELIIPGVPAGPGPRRLQLAVPGSAEASVRVNVVTSEGTYVPEGKQGLSVQPGAVTSIGLGEALAKRAAAVRVTASVPVIASMSVGTSDGLAYTAATPPLTGDAIVAEGGATAGVTSRLLLSAPMKEGAVQVRMLGDEGTIGEPETVRIPSARTVSVELSPPEHVEGNYAVVVTPVEGSDPLYGARALRREDGGKVTVLPLRSSDGWVRVPDADESLRSVIAAD